jgi:tRNA A37 threonylcarbamoyladenosine dehydratase
MDDICITNINRQVHALQETIGCEKISVMAERLLQINPELTVHQIDDFAGLDNLDDIVSDSYHMVVDAIDSAKIKSALINYCRRRKMQIITVGSAGGKVDPRRVVSGDLSKTIKDPLLSRVRKQLRQQYGFPRGPKKVFSVEAVYSPEQMVYPAPDGGICENKPSGESVVNLDCSGGFGSVTMVTAAFAMTASSRAIARYLERA